jgi:O-antigen/teichoic acid export membrane protein
MGAGSAIREATSGWRTSVVLRIFATIAGVGASVLIARLGGPEAKGVAAAYLASITTVFAVTNLGAGEQIVQITRDGNHSARRLLIRFWFAYAAVAGLIAVVFLPVRPQLSVLTIGCLLYLIPIQASTVSIGFSGVMPDAIGALVQPLAVCAGVLLLSVDGGLTPNEAVGALAVSYLAPFYVYWRGVPARGEARGVTLRELGRATLDGARWQVPNLALRIVQRADILAVFVLAGPAASGRYSVAVQLAELCFLVPRQIANHSYHQTTVADSLDTRRAVMTTIVAATATAVPIGLLGGFGINLLYGEAFTAATGDLYILLPGTVVGSVAFLMFWIFRGKGRLRMSTISSLSGAFTLLVGCGFLIPQFGTAGAAVSCSVAWGVFAVVAVTLHRRRVTVAA